MYGWGELAKSYYLPYITRGGRRIGTFPDRKSKKSNYPPPKKILSLASLSPPFWAEDSVIPSHVMLKICAHSARKFIFQQFLGQFFIFFCILSNYKKFRAISSSFDPETPSFWPENHPRGGDYPRGSKCRSYRPPPAGTSWPGTHYPPSLVMYATYTTWRVEAWQRLVIEAKLYMWTTTIHRHNISILEQFLRTFLKFFTLND